MPLPISPILTQPVVTPATASAPTGKPGEFRNALEGAIQAVEQLRGDAAQAVQSFLSGESEELHTAALATQRAELALEFGLQVRSKVVQAYQEIMRMPM